ncbi:MAG: hypothetical protein L3K18_00080 [Thermoplasmata archaeon]|nr:hypothetical protein [Thermoplasmata archaeon]
MPVCPACGFASTDDGPACARCGLSVELFVPVREAAGLPDSDPEFGRSVQEILDAVGDLGSAPTEPASLPRLAQAFRFPTLGSPRTEPAPAEPDALQPIRSMPELPPAKELAVVRRQVEEYLQIARRQGLDTTDFVQRGRAAAAASDAGSFEALGRELFIHIAGSITEEFESLVARRNELARIAPTSGPDVEFESCRSSLALGDVGGAQRRLRHLDDTLTRLEDEWAPTLILISQAEALAETTRELGGDPSPALGPLREGRRLAKRGERAAAEPLLARAGLGLWSVLEPTFVSELARLKDRLLAERSAGRDVGPALVELRSIAPDLRRRSFLAVIDSYRRLRELAGTPGTLPPEGLPSS